MCDFFLLLTLLYLKSYHYSAGLSNYTSIDGNIFETPKFKCDKQFLTSYEKE